MYALAKFQPDMPIALGVMALQSGNNNFYSKYWENKLQALTKPDVTHEWNVTQSCKLHHCVFHEWGIYYSVSFSQYHPPSLCIEMKSVLIA